jgi:hypothetical protein
MKWLCCAFTLLSLFSLSTCNPDFDSLLIAAERIDRVLYGGDPPGYHSLSAMLKRVPQPAKDEFSEMFGSLISRYAISATHHEHDISRAIDTARQFLNTQTAHLLEYQVCGLASTFNSSLCNLKSPIGALATNFIDKFNWTTTHSIEHAGRPLAGVTTSFQGLALRAFFWLSFALLHSVSFWNALLDLKKTRWTSSEAQIEESNYQEREEQWDVLTAVFMNFKQWQAAIRGSERLQELTNSLCADHTSRSTETELSPEKLEECWTSRMLRRKLTKNTLLSYPEGIAAFFALALLFRESSSSMICPILPTEFMCTNSNFVHSICILTCPNIRDGSGKIITQRMVPRVKRVVCGDDGRWLGGPTECLLVPPQQLDSPLIVGPPEFQTR